MAFSAHGKYWFKEDSWRDYERVPWSTINDSSRRKIIKHLMPKPEACPNCGKPGAVDEYGMERVLLLCNRSGYLRKSLDDWYWTCRDCHKKSNREKHQRYPAGPGDKLKPWADLSRRGRVSRVRRDLPKPAVCPYCDCSVVELVNRSGKWLEDLNDYVWCCRSHRYVIERLRVDHEPKQFPVIIEWPCELFPWLYSNSMSGTFKGHSILNKTSAGGRFYTISDTFLKEEVRS